MIGSVKESIDFIVNCVTNKIYNVRGEIITTNSLEKYHLNKTLCILDKINQPYPQNFLQGDELLTNLIKDIDNVCVANQIIMNIKISNKEPDNIYNRIGKDVCFHHIRLKIDKNNNVIPIDNIKFNESINVINAYTGNYIIIFLPLEVENASLHQIVIYIDTLTSRTIIFDPSYYNNYEFKDMCENISAFFYEHINIKISTMKDLNLPYRLQISSNDYCCISWSAYLTVLFLLNDKSPAEIIKHLYYLDIKYIKCVIPRFLVWLERDIMESILEVA